MKINGNILLADNDYYFGQAVKKRLEEQGHIVTLAYDGEVAWNCYRSRPFDLCLFEIAISKKNGLELAQLIRQKDSFIPILFLSSRSDPDDVLEGFRHGGDSYLIKPIGMQELLMRIRVFLKRMRPLDMNKAAKYPIGPLTFLPADLKLINEAGKQVGPDLSKREAELLKYLCQNANRIIKREEILFHVWGKDDFFMGRSMDVFMTKLRKRFKMEPGVELITVRNIGFRFKVSTL